MLSNQFKLAIEVEGVNKSFEVVGEQVKVLKEVSFQIPNNQFAIIYGPSGSGKSTLLHTILGLEKPNLGTVKVLGQNIYINRQEDWLANFRKAHIGMVYQQANWVKALNVLENVALPLMLLGETKQARLIKAEKMLNMLQMKNWSFYHPSELSSGQQQRISLARALITNPEIIIADEPTGNLDFDAGEELMQLLKNFQTQTNKTVVMVTHDLEYLKYADQAIQLFDGSIKKVFSPKKHPQLLKDVYAKRKIYETLD